MLQSCQMGVLSWRLNSQGDDSIGLARMTSNQYHHHIININEGLLKQWWKGSQSVAVQRVGSNTLKALSDKSVKLSKNVICNTDLWCGRFPASSLQDVDSYQYHFRVFDPVGAETGLTFPLRPGLVFILFYLKPDHRAWFRENTRLPRWWKVWWWWEVT